MKSHNNTRRSSAVLVALESTSNSIYNDLNILKIWQKRNQNMKSFEFNGRNNLNMIVIHDIFSVRYKLKV
jgi:hypothetical protein